MSRPPKKTTGRRATGIQAKAGKLYIVLSRTRIKNGRTESYKEWLPTGLKDNPANVKLAIRQREELINRNKPIELNPNISMEELVDFFIESKRDIANTTLDSYIRRTNHVKAYFKDIKVKNIRKKDVESFLDDLFLVDNLAPRTVRDIKTVFRQVMDIAMKNGITPINVVSESVINRALSDEHELDKDDDETFFSIEEANEFLEDNEDDQLYELFYFILNFALRRSEALGLKWSAINFAKAEFTIKHTVTVGSGVNRNNRTKSKNSKRTFPLTEEQMDMLIYLKRKEDENREIFRKTYIENDYIFKKPNGEQYYPGTISKYFKRLVNKNKNLPQDITLHGLRTSCASILVAEGEDIKSIQKWLGHADIETTLKIYAKVKEKEAKLNTSNTLKHKLKAKKYLNNN